MIKKSAIVFFIVFGGYFVLLSQSQQNTHLKDSIEALLVKNELVGAVWVVVNGDNIETGSAGFNSINGSKKMQASDKIHVGSIAKTVLSIGIMRLHTIGKLDIDQPVKSILPELPLINPWELSHPVTIRHLMNHTSGLPDLRLWHFFSTSATPNTPLKELYEKAPNLLSVQQKPGDLFSYSNIGYAILGMIIEAVTNERYESFLDKNILEPLGMKNSTFNFTSQIGEHKDATLAMGHYDNQYEAHALPIYLRPAGQFTTTARDMGIFLKFLMTDGAINNAVFVDANLMSAIGHTNQTIAARKGLKAGYSFGAALRDRHGVIGITHSGNIIGYRAMIYAFPQEQKAFFISHNMDSESADYEVFNTVLINNLNLSRPENPILDSKPLPKDINDWQGYYIPAVNKITVFKILDYIVSFTQFKVENNDITLHPFQNKQTKLIHLGDHIYKVPDRISASHALYSEGENKFITNGIINLKKVSGLKIFTLGLSFILGLLSLAGLFFYGIYQFTQTQTSILKNENLWPFFGILLLLLSGFMIYLQPFIELGDKTFGSMLFYLATIFLPFSLLLSFVEKWRSARILKSKMFTIFLVMGIQFCIVLYYWGMIPFALWKD
jgi:CubicO group peptidase (beta-lactamase class C family)